jgi:hypothetical protein
MHWFRGRHRSFTGINERGRRFLLIARSEELLMYVLFPRVCSWIQNPELLARLLEMYVQKCWKPLQRYKSYRLNRASLPLIQLNWRLQDSCQRSKTERISLVTILSRMLRAIDVNGMPWDLTTTTEIFHGQINPAFLFVRPGREQCLRSIRSTLAGFDVLSNLVLSKFLS